jgi:NAD(P)-dependent dehydrogenase (short-subunit alcohol dehydrogenase family)
MQKNAGGIRRFSDRTAVVTGAGQGLGAAFARGLAAEGASVALIGRTEEKLERTAAEIRSACAGQVLVCPGDVSRETDVTAIFSKIFKTLGEVDILINNAAVHHSAAVAQMPLEEWERQIAVNLTGTFLCSRAVLPGMIGRLYGKILNISSSAATHPFRGFGAYSASKAGMIGFTLTLSEEVKECGINVNVLLLGMTDTEGTRKRMGRDPAVTAALGDMLQVDAAAETALFFVSDQASAVMGAAVDVFGRTH